MSRIASRYLPWKKAVPDDGQAGGAETDADTVPGMDPEYLRLLRRVGVLDSARLAASNITLLVARIWDDYESEPSARVAPSAATIAGWVQQARMLDEAKQH